MFNTNTRKKNILLSSGFGVLEQVITYLTGFAFRTAFLMVLSSSYLGITGLFTNVLQVFSLAELGIGSVISYRLYEPIKRQDKEKCGQLLAFYRTMYIIIAAVVVVMGALFSPYLSHVIADASEIPADVNINTIYWLFVFQTATSYLCIYMQSLLIADQKGYVVSTANSISMISMNVVKIALLFMTRNYTLVLAVGIVFNLCFNICFNVYIRNKYSEITKEKYTKLSRAETVDIFKDTGALMCHKIGYTVVNSTDSIILSKYIGLSVLGIYSNYSLITTAVDAVLNKVFGSFVSTIGNFSIDATEDVKYDSYKKLRFLNVWAASFCAICIYVLINPFIKVWLGESFLLDHFTVVIISSNLFINSSRIINTSYVNATGLFVKDKLRPLVQAVINLVVSIMLVKAMGISGVFIGTIVSTLLTVWWREAIIMYRLIFHKSTKEYYIYYVFWAVVTTVVALFMEYLCSMTNASITGFILKMIICGAGINLIYILLFSRTENFRFYRKLVTDRLSARKGNE